jgi:cold shock CspA family protein
MVKIAKPDRESSDLEKAVYQNDMHKVHLDHKERDDMSTTKTDKVREKMILIESHKADPGLVFLVYFIQHSRDSKRFLVSKINTAQREQVQSAGTEEYKPVDFQFVSLVQVSEWIVKQTSRCRRLNSTANDEEIGNTKKRPRLMPKTDSSKSQLQEGTVHSWNTTKGYGFVKGDETTENIFFHTSRVRTRGWEPVKGERVKYYVGFDDKKSRDTAVDVEVIDWHVHSPSIGQQYRPTKTGSYRENEKCPLRLQTRHYPTAQYRDPQGEKDWQHDHYDNCTSNKRSRNDDNNFHDQYGTTNSNCECSRILLLRCSCYLAVLLFADVVCVLQIVISCNTKLSTRCGIKHPRNFPPTHPVTKTYLALIQYPPDIYSEK